MRRWLPLAWLGVIGPLVASAAIGGPMGVLPHPVYHLVYILVSLAALYPAARLRAAGSTAAVRTLALVLSVSIWTNILGQLGQEVVVLTHGGFHADPRVFTDPLHLAGAMLSLLALVVGVSALVALSVVRAGIPGRLARTGIHPR